MAKKISDEIIKLSIIIDGNEAQKELYEKEKAIRDLNAQQKELRKEKQLLERQGKKDTEQYRSVTASIKENSSAIAANKSRMAELQKEIGILGLSTSQLRSKATQLRAELAHMIPGSSAYLKKDAELKALVNRLDELKGKSQATKWSLGSMADGFNRYAALGATIVASLTGVVVSIQKVIDYNSKLSDSISNVRKTTGMTNDEVNELLKTFGLFKTRTGRIELLGIAEVGGRLGIAKEDIQSFVQVMDKASVALGDSFEGGPEVVAEKLGRIKGLYDELKNANVELAFESVGSALNDLGAAGTASEANVAEFVTRVGAMPAVLKPSIQTALGLGAAFEESGLKAEIAGTNYSKVISVASRDIGAFAEVMRRPRKEMEALINSNPNEFFLQFADGLKGLDATELSQVLDYLKLNDNEVKMVLGAASQNIEMFREKIQLAAESMSDATSLTTEFDIKNTNLAATLERLKKTIIGIFSSETVVEWLTSSVNAFAKFIGAIEDSDGSVTRFRNSLVFLLKIIVVMITSWLSYNAAIRLTTAFTRSLAAAQTLLNVINGRGKILTDILKASTLLMSAAYHAATGNITRATAAMRIFNVVSRANPFGILLTAIVAVGAALVMFKKNTGDVSKELNTISSTTQILAKRNSEMEASFAKSSAEIRSKIEPLIRILKDQNTHLNTRKLAYEELIRINPAFIGTVNEEFRATSKLDEVYGNLLEKLQQKLRAEANMKVMAEFYDNEAAAVRDLVKLEKELEGIRQKRIESDKLAETLTGDAKKNQREKSVDYEIEWNRVFAKVEKQKEKLNQATSDLKIAENWRANEIKRLEGQLSQLKKGTLEYQKVQSELLSLLGNVEKTDPVKKTSSYKVIDKDADKAAEKAERAHEKRMADLKKQEDEVRELKRKGIDDGLSLLDDGFDKELAIQNEHHSRRIEDLKRQMISETDIKKAQAHIDNPKSTPQDVDFWTRQKQVWLEKNQHLNTLLRHEESLHYNKVGTIIEKEYASQIKKLDEHYKKQKTIREREFLQSLNSISTLKEAKEQLQGKISDAELRKIDTLEKAKKKLQEEFDKEEQEREIKYLEDTIAKMEQQLQTFNFKGIDLSLLTPEQREKIEKEIEAARLLAEKLKSVLNNKSEEGGKQSVEARDENMKRVFEGMNGGADVLGFTPQQWQQTYDNLDTLHGKMTAAAMVVTALQNMWGSYDQAMTNAENNRIQQYERGSNRRKLKLQWELDNGYISQVQYNKSVSKLEMEVERQKAEIEYKQAKRKKAMAIVETIMNTSIAIMQAFSQLGPIGGAIAAVLIGTMGALQLKTIIDQPLPARGYEKGLYPEYVKREQDGKVFKSRYGGKTRSGLVNSPTHFLVAEKGPEMVIDDQAYRDLSPETRNALIRELSGIKGWENGLYNNKLKRFETPVAPGEAQAAVARTNVSEEYFLSVINRNSDILEKIYKEGVIAFMSKDPRELKKLIEEMERLQNSKEKAKV